MQNLNWDGTRNVRDLGGLSTSLSSTGMTILGRIARGPRREFLTTAGWACASQWGLRSIVDLRSENEVGSQHTDPNVSPPEGLTISLAPTEDQANPEFYEACVPILDSPEYWRHNVRILPALVRGALEAVAGSEPGVLVHCAAGRDRTGMVSALLLAHAGVPAKDIVNDYAESVRAMSGWVPPGSPTHDRQASWTPQQTAQWLVDVEPHVHSFVADPETVLDELGVAIETRQVLRSMLTAASF